MPRKPHKTPKKIRDVKYVCQGGKKITVRYGFNAQNLPTYAQATLNGKARFMPLNQYRTEAVSTVFGDDDNFSLMANRINYKNVRSSSMNIQSPSGEILFKGCTAPR